jgi:hypothetical protein
MHVDVKEIDRHDVSCDQTGLFVRFAPCRVLGPFARVHVTTGL